MESKELRDFFLENYILRGDLGAGVSVWKDGEEIFEIAGGWSEKGKANKWTNRTLAPVYSATKAPASATLLHVLDQGGIPVETNVCDV